MKLVEINFSDMVANSINFKNNEQLKELIELFAKYLKVKNYSSCVYDFAIHIDTAKFNYDIEEKRTNKFVIVKEDNFNHREIKYVELKD